MQNHTNPKPTRSSFTLLRQLCNLIPKHLVPHLARTTCVANHARSPSSRAACYRIRKSPSLVEVDMPSKSDSFSNSSFTTNTALLISFTGNLHSRR